MTPHLPFHAEFFTFLIIAGLLVPLAARMRLNPVLAFLLAGVLIGPYGLGRLTDEFPLLGHVVVRDVENVALLGEFGVIFLLFSIGLELSARRLWAMRRLVFGLGMAQVLLTAMAIGVLASFWDHNPVEAMIIGCALALSSTAMVIKIIMDRKQFASPMGQGAFSILLMQDLAVVPMIFMIALFAQEANGHSPFLTLLLSLAKAAAAIGVIYVLGRYVARPALRFLTVGAAGPEYFMAQIFLLVIGAAWITGEAGLSLALGAFLAGLILAETEFRNQVEIDIEPFKGLFLGLFFMSVGMKIDVFAVADNFAGLFMALLGLFTLKAFIAGGLCRLFGLPAPAALHTGLALGQAGEFAFVLFGLAIVGGLLPDSTAHFMLLLTSLTLVVTPLFYSIGESLAKALEKRASAAPDAGISLYMHDLHDHVVIAGFGRTGQGIADMLYENQIPYVALEQKAANLEKLRAQGQPVYYGDAGDVHMLDKVRATEARAIVLAMDDSASSHKAIAYIRRHCQKVPIYARARDAAHAEKLYALGVNEVVLETVEMSLQLAGRVLRCYDYSDSATTRAIENERMATAQAVTE